MNPNSVYRQEARALLKGHWTQPVVATLIFQILVCVVSAFYIYPMFGALVALAALPLFYSYTQNFLLYTRNNDTELIDRLFYGYKEFGRSFATALLYHLFIALWTLLLIVPGIIMSLAYSMTFFVAKDHPELSAYDCIVYSKKMMKGHKASLFMLWLSFIGWALLCILTFGIGYLWLIPYIYVSQARFYDDVKREYEQPEE